jgi:hypothetical protein
MTNIYDPYDYDEPTEEVTAEDRLEALAVEQQDDDPAFAEWLFGTRAA